MMMMVMMMMTYPMIKSKSPNFRQGSKIKKYKTNPSTFRETYISLVPTSVHHLLLYKWFCLHMIFIMWSHMFPSVYIYIYIYIIFLVKNSTLDVPLPFNRQIWRFERFGM